jgi:hypothetical protein
MIFISRGAYSREWFIKVVFPPGNFKLIDSTEKVKDLFRSGFKTPSKAQ